MIARVLAAVRALLVLLSLAGILAAWRAGYSVPGMLALMMTAPMVVLAGVYGIEGAWMLRRAKDDPATPAPSPTQVVRSLAEEMVRAAAVFLWHQPSAGHRDVAHLVPERHRGRTGALLVHGYFCNAGFWNHWSGRMTRTDRPHLAVTLEPAFGAIDDMVPDLDVAVRRLWAVTRRPVILVCHSMGGLVVRAWWRRHAGWADAHVARVITIGTPHLGTTLATWSRSATTRPMRPDSPWLRHLAADEPPARAQRFLCIHSDCDNVVFPPNRARLPGASALLVTGCAHIAMVRRREVIAAVDEAIAEADADAEPPPTGRLPPI